MKEFIEKLIGRLEEYQIGYRSGYGEFEDELVFRVMCNVISIVKELAEEHNGGGITDRNPTKEECKNNRFWITDSDRWSYEADFDLECERWRDLETGGFINVVAWHILPLPAPYTEGE